ncbi:MAG: DUF559 domain-containing protein [Nitrospirae bacterium]|nr:DUF559 domain-containing protein [Nitrospirota bacterium]
MPDYQRLGSHSIERNIRTILFFNGVSFSVIICHTILWSKLKGKGLGFKFRRQYSIGRFIVDFYCPALKLAIEIDGNSHYTEAANISDRAREEIIERYGCVFLRFTNQEIYENSDGAIAKIMECINGLTSPTPLCKGGVFNHVE